MTNVAEIMGQNPEGPADAIDADYEARNENRHHLGLSEVGNKCERALWYTHHDSPRKDFSGRILRLLQLGNLIETQVITDLKSAGYLHHSDQKEVTFTHEGLTLKGHIDGIVERLVESKQPHLFECKSASDKKFKELVKLGSYEAWNQVYKTQIHVYMLGLKLKRCLVVVYNKNDSTLYTERIRLKRDYAIKMLERVFNAISGDIPDRMNNNPGWYECKWCDYYKECFK